ncbi:hypothetical protein [Apilactobacillus micheneri]|uniref:hypothetical protein n=1 Tax=Apilactobacillus micheneri TaxID=1899430 RepID=UPI0015E84073|nr:hypothetical protein [Apilactobacillus micheneri]
MLTIDIVSLSLGLLIGLCAGTIFSSEINLIIKTAKKGITSYVQNYKKTIQDK